MLFTTYANGVFIVAFEYNAPIRSTARNDEADSVSVSCTIVNGQPRINVIISAAEAARLNIRPKDLLTFREGVGSDIGSVLASRTNRSTGETGYVVNLNNPKKPEGAIRVSFTGTILRYHRLPSEPQPMQKLEYTFNKGAIILNMPVWFTPIP
jgi:hypothetical protein